MLKLDKAERNPKGKIPDLVEMGSEEPAEFGQGENLCQVSRMVIV